MSHNEARVSINVKLTGPNGGDFLLTVREGATPEDVDQCFYALVEGLKSAKAEYHLVVAGSKNNTVTIAPINGNGLTGEEPLCPTHQKRMKPSKHGGYFCPQQVAPSGGGEDGSKPIYCKAKA